MMVAVWWGDDGIHGGHVMIMLLVDRWWRCGGARLKMDGVVAAAVVVLLEAEAARGGEWGGGSYRSGVHNTFHVSKLKKCYADEPLAVPLDGLHFDDKLHFVEEPVEIMDQEVKRLKRSSIPIVMVRWNSRRGPEFTWEREDQFRKKYPHIFTKTSPSSSAAS
nr:putative reverse transcriptase domain-containing protein [Tanacetum cinerariifolium]